MSLVRPWRAPVTTLSQMVLIGVYACTFGLADATGRPLWELRRKWGSVEPLQWVSKDTKNPTVIEPNLEGPFDLWDGQWWRIPACNLHHGDLMHLIMNLSFVSYFGTMLERRWGSLKYILLILSSSLVVMLPEYLSGRYAVGYSGVGCAIFGALWAMRHRDPVIAERMPNELVIGTLLALAAMVFLTLAEVLPVANGAHAAGLAYGYLAATAGAVGQSWRGVQRTAFVLSHVGLIYPYWLVTHPTWNGKYVWYRADLPGENGRRKEPDWDGLSRAVALDPTLTEVWRKLAERAQSNGDDLEAWRLLVRGLAAAPSDAEQWNQCRALWRRICIAPEAAVAKAFVAEQLGAEAGNILRELRRVIPSPVLIAPGRPVEPTPSFVQVDSPPEPPEYEPPPERIWPPRRETPAMPPPSNNAVEGVTL